MIRRIRNSPLAKNSLTYLIANTNKAAIPFLLLPVLTRALGPGARSGLGRSRPQRSGKDQMRLGYLDLRTSRPKLGKRGKTYGN